MSGGSYDYLYLASWLDKEPNFIISRAGDMSEDMRSDGFYDCAYEFDRFVQDYRMFTRMMEFRFKRLKTLMHDWEWYRSGDYGKERFEESWKEFLEGTLREI